jgi:hypothetical protein
LSSLYHRSSASFRDSFLGQEIPDDASEVVEQVVRRVGIVLVEQPAYPQPEGEEDQVMVVRQVAAKGRAMALSGHVLRIPSEVDTGYLWCF